MRTTMLAMAAVAAVITAAPALTGTASADSIRLAQDIRVGPPGVAGRGTPRSRSDRGTSSSGRRHRGNGRAQARRLRHPFREHDPERRDPHGERTGLRPLSPNRSPRFVKMAPHLGHFHFGL